MPVPAAIASQVTALDDAITAAGDLGSASYDTLNALAYQAGQTASAVELAIPANAGALDSWTPPLMPGDITTGVLGLLSAAQTQSSLTDLKGYVARIEINLENR